MKLNKQIHIPDNVTVTVSDNLCIFSGLKGTISYNVHTYLNVDFNNNILFLYFNDKFILKRRDRLFLPAVFNTNFVMLKNCLFGVNNLFECYLILKGVGYKAIYDKNTAVLTMILGYSHPVTITVPSDIFLDVPSVSEIIVRSLSKSRAGQFAADLRAVKLPDSYKGNGIRYRDEKIILKTPKKTK